MAISGAVVADRNTIAQRRGRSRKEVAADINYTVPTPTAVSTPSTGQISVALTNWGVPTSIDFGDGRPPTLSAAGVTPVVRTGMAAGTYVVTTTGLDGRVKRQTGVVVT